MRGVGPSGRVGDKWRSERLEIARKPQAVNISCPQGNQGWHPNPHHSRSSHSSRFSCSSGACLLSPSSSSGPARLPSLPASVPCRCFLWCSHSQASQAPPLSPLSYPMHLLLSPILSPVLSPCHTHTRFCDLYHHPDLGTPGWLMKGPTDRGRGKCREHWNLTRARSQQR